MINSDKYINYQEHQYHYIFRDLWHEVIITVGQIYSHVSIWAKIISTIH